MTIFPGYWCDVFAHPEGIGLLMFEPNSMSVALYVNSVLRGRTNVPDSLLYLRACADSSSTVAFIAQPGNTPGTMTGVCGASAQIQNVTCYSRPAVGHDGTNFVFYVQTSARTWRRGVGFDSLLGAPDQPIPTWSGGTGMTSQGISQVPPATPTVVWHDQVGRVVQSGLTMLNAATANGVWVGQGQETGMVGTDQQAKPFLAMDFAPQEPRVAYSPGRGVWAVCSHNLKPEVGYNEMPPFVPLAAEPDPPTGDEPPTTPIVSFPNYRVPSIPAVGRRLLVMPFFATDLRNGEFAAPGNRQVIVNGTVLAGNDLMNVPVFADLQSSKNPWERMAGLYGGANADTLDNAGLKCAFSWLKQRNSSVLLLRYYDGPNISQEFVNQCEPDTVVLVQCYPLAGETASTSMTRFRASVKRVTDAGRKVGIVRAMNSKFGGNGSFAEQVANILAIQEPLCTLVRETPTCLVDAYFSYGRWKKIDGKIVDCGAAYCAEFQAWTKKLASLAT